MGECFECADRGGTDHDELHEDSDIDIAIVLDEITDRYTERKQVSELRSQLSLQENTVVSIFLTTETNFSRGRFAIHRATAINRWAIILCPYRT